MALIWKKIINDTTYEVRKAGASIRLYTDGIFHSQFNPKKPLNGSIWDLLVLPIFFSPHIIQRILVLGLGGGAAVRTLQRLLPHAETVAVELDKNHIIIANKFFGVKPNKRLNVIHGDAIQWLKAYKGQKFDYIVDDLFIEQNGEPGRAIAADSGWAKALGRQLNPKGLITLNFPDLATLKKSAFFIDPTFKTRFQSRYVFSTPGYENRMLALSQSALSKTNLSSALTQAEQAAKISLQKYLKANIRRC